MIGRLARLFIAVVLYFSAATLMAEGIMAAYVASAWRLDREKLVAMLAAARGMLPASPAEPQAREPRSEEQPSYDQVLEARRNARCESALREQSLASALVQLRVDQRKLGEEQSRYLAERAKYAEELAAAKKLAASTGREEVRRILQAMKPKQAKETLVQMLDDKETADVVALLSGMPDAKQAKIFAEFKTAEENAKIKEVLRLIRQGEPDNGLANKCKSVFSSRRKTGARKDPRMEFRRRDGLRRLSGTDRKAAVNGLDEKGDGRMSRLQLDNPSSWNTVELSNSASISAAFNPQGDDFGQHLERAQNAWNQPAADTPSDNGASASLSRAPNSLASPSESAPSQSAEMTNNASGDGTPTREASSSKSEDGNQSPSPTKGGTSTKSSDGGGRNRDKHCDDASATTGNPAVPTAVPTAALAASLPRTPAGNNEATNAQDVAGKPIEYAVESRGKEKTPPSPTDPSMPQPSSGATPGSQESDTVDAASSVAFGVDDGASGAPGHVSQKKAPTVSLLAQPSAADLSAETASPGSFPANASSPTATGERNPILPNGVTRSLYSNEPNAISIPTPQCDPSIGSAVPIESAGGQIQSEQPVTPATPKIDVANKTPAANTRRTTGDNGHSLSSGNDTGSGGVVGAKPAAGTGNTESSSAGPSQNGSGGDHVDQAQLIQRIAQAFEAAVERGGSIHLQLSPPELGSLRVELTVRNGAMSARMETETDAARTILQDNLPALRERLAEHNIRVERFDVNLSGQSSGNLPGRSGSSSSPYDPRGGQSTPSSNRVPSAAGAIPASHSTSRPGTRSHFDVVV